jgi:hypothetical protein
VHDVVTFQENAENWEAIAAKSKRGAAPTATAMAKYLADRTRYDTLTRSSHAPGSWHRTKAGEPPAYASGNLARGMMYIPASQGAVERATAYVGNRVDYSRILEFGCVIQPTNKKFLHWTDTGGSWYHTFLVVPPHPFLEPTVDESIADGSLRDAAIEGFTPYDP